MALFLFQVVFMETAGYIIIGAIAERISFAGFLLAEIAMGAIIYPIYGMLGVGRRLDGAPRHVAAPRPRRRRLRRLGRRARDGRLGRAGARHDARAAHREVQQGRQRRTRSPVTTSPFVVIGTLVLFFGWMGFNPGSTLGATDLRIALVAVNTLLAACAGFVMAMACTNAKYGQARHLDVVQRHARRTRRDHRAVRVRRAVGGRDHRRHRRRRSCATASRSSTTAQDRRPVRRDLRARSLRRCGACSRSGCSPTGRTPAVGWNGVNQPVTGLFYGGGLGQLGAQIFDVGVGSSGHGA